MATLVAAAGTAVARRLGSVSQAQFIERAMKRAIDDALRQGVVDPAEQLARKLVAREQASAAWAEMERQAASAPQTEV